MRRFEVWLNRCVPGVDSTVEVIEMPDDATDEECEQACRECLHDMIGSLLDTGWNDYWIESARSHSRQFEAIRAALCAGPEEDLVEAARRMKAERDEAITLLAKAKAGD